MTEQLSVERRRDMLRTAFGPSIAAALTRCLSLLDLVKTPDDVTLWLNRCKAVMRRVMHVEKASLRERYDVLLEAIESEGTTT